jgi:hypothetical protein
MKKKIVEFGLSFIVALGILAIISFIIRAVIQVILSIISGNFLLMGLPAVFIIVFGIYVLFVTVKELK